MEKLVPKEIFCPRCGHKMELESIEDAKMLEELKKLGFISGARGICSCGLVAVLNLKPLPESPTFTLCFNIYKFEG